MLICSLLCSQVRDYGTEGVEENTLIGTVTLAPSLFETRPFTGELPVKPAKGQQKTTKAMLKVQVKTVQWTFQLNVTLTTS